MRTFSESIRNYKSFCRITLESAKSSKRTQTPSCGRKIVTNGMRATRIVTATGTATVEMAEQLRKDPSLINNREFLENHPALQQYLQSHPEVREEFQENPNAFMRQENRYERHEDDDRDRDRDRDRGRRDGDTTRRELASMDRFMDGHPEIAEQLRKDPSLINNREFVENHPALQQYLQSHPEVREELKENRNAFMRQENRYERHEGDDRDRDRGRRDGDTTRKELASMDRFMDGHPEIAEQLRENAT